jgi:hypothetical protein
MVHRLFSISTAFRGHDKRSFSQTNSNAGSSFVKLESAVSALFLSTFENPTHSPLHKEQHSMHFSPTDFHLESIPQNARADEWSQMEGGGHAGGSTYDGDAEFAVVVFA